jgi:hypothetical protein
MLDMAEYTKYDDDNQGNGNGHNGNGNGHNGNGNGYDKLSGDYGLFYKVAKRFNHRVKPEDKEDFLHDLFIQFAKVSAGYQAKGKELTEGGLMRVAKFELANYWRRHFKRVNGVECSRCAKIQRAKCKDSDLYRDCPKAISMESLDRLVEDGNGDSTPFAEFIADNRAVDLVAIVEAKFTLNSYPAKAVKLLYKRYAGYPLDVKERDYLRNFRKRLQKTLF